MFSIREANRTFRALYLRTPHTNAKTLGCHFYKSIVSSLIITYFSFRCHVAPLFSSQGYGNSARDTCTRIEINRTGLTFRAEKIVAQKTSNRAEHFFTETRPVFPPESVYKAVDEPRLHTSPLLIAELRSPAAKTAGDGVAKSTPPTEEGRDHRAVGDFLAGQSQAALRLQVQSPGHGLRPGLRQPPAVPLLLRQRALVRPADLPGPAGPELRLDDPGHREPLPCARQEPQGCRLGRRRRRRSGRVARVRVSRRGNRDSGPLGAAERSVAEGGRRRDSRVQEEDPAAPDLRFDQICTGSYFVDGNECFSFMCLLMQIMRLFGAHLSFV